MAREVRKRSSCLQALHLSSSRELLQEGVQGHVRLLAAAAADGEGLARLALPQTTTYGNLLQLGLADPLRERLVATSTSGAKAVHAQLVSERFGLGRYGGATGSTRTCSGASQSGKSPRSARSGSR